MKIELFKDRISESRLRPFINIAKKEDDAVALYIANMKVSEKLYIPLHMFEVVLRNAVFKVLKKAYGERCFEESLNVFLQKEYKNISIAKESILKDRKKVTPDQIVAELNLGFWISMFNNPYEKFWRSDLHQVFCNRPKKFTRRIVRNKLQKVRLLRNRVAHYESIINKGNVLEDYHHMIDIISWICPEIAKWIEQEGNFLKVYNVEIASYLSKLKEAG